MARCALEATGWYAVKLALVMLLAGVDAAEAQRRLAAAKGSVRRAVEIGKESGEG
jgi:N-acetylmuramic acid 6-phosphate (MurNAc-6-P) etherase